MPARRRVRRALLKSDARPIAPPIVPTPAPVGIAILAASPALRPLSPSCWIVPSPSSFTVCFFAPGRLSTMPGISTTDPFGKMIEVKCISSCALPFTRPGAHHAVHDALYVNSCRNHHPVSDHHRKCGSKVNPVPSLRALGVDGASQLQQHLGAGGNGVGLFPAQLRPRQSQVVLQRSAL